VIVFTKKEAMDHKPINIFTVLDLEMNQPSRKIISVGSVVGDISTGNILQKLHIFVNPNERLHPDITKLTKIEQSDVNRGHTLEEAYFKLKTMHDRHYSFINCVTWGGNDAAELQQQLIKENPHFQEWCFGRRCLDVKTLFVSWRFANGKPIQGGLARSMTKVGLAFRGQKHNSADDAENTFYMYRSMLCLMKEIAKKQ
jgi:inhibitor of KinA sporulation pathway (predicted exonuclease)